MKPKIYDVQIGEKAPFTHLFIRALTKQGAVNAAAKRLIRCEYASQNALYLASKNGVTLLDATVDENQPTLTGIDPPPVLPDAIP